MRFKPVPPAPESLDAVAAVQRAVPLVPGSEADCCARVLDRTHVTERDDARTWLTFLRALELVRETDGEFVRERAVRPGGGPDGRRTSERGAKRPASQGEPRPARTATEGSRERHEPERDALADAFRDRVYAADEVLAALDAADRPLSTDEVFDRVADEIPAWERGKDPGGWRATWRERVRRLLAWAVLLGLAERDGEGYVRA
jgi:hypothetical protein